MFEAGAIVGIHVNSKLSRSKVGKEMRKSAMVGFRRIKSELAGGGQFNQGARDTNKTNNRQQIKVKKRQGEIEAEKEEMQERMGIGH